MPRCPMCNKDLVELPRKCPSCKADLDLLVDFVSNMQGRLEQADNMTRNGELAQAVWTYLEVLELDPANPAARRQVSQVATAVRIFDQIKPSRRWAMHAEPRRPLVPGWLLTAIAALLIAIAFSVGFVLGTHYEEGENGDAPPPQEPDKSIGGQKK